MDFCVNVPCEKLKICDVVEKSLDTKADVLNLETVSAMPLNNIVNITGEL